MSNYQRGGRHDARGFQGRVDRPVAMNSRGNNNSSFNRNQQPQTRLSPWEGGVAPGAGSNMMNMGSMGGPNRSSGGLLPTPNMPLPGPGLLPQPSMQDVQLAVANNVLNLLLPGMQQNQQQNQMPPVLGLGSNRPGLLGPPVFQNPNLGGTRHQVSQGSKDNSGPSRPRPFMSGRRPEPYNKGNRNRPGPKNEERKVPNNPPRGQSSGTSSKNISHQARTNKDNKGDGRNNQKIGDSSTNKGKDSTFKQDFNKEDIEREKADFTDIPPELLTCHICSKSMWDTISFINHIKGKAHHSMIDRREESYNIQIDMMRRQMKVEEQQRQIDVDRMKRQGKSVGIQSREYCTMCNLNFNGSLSAHRKSDSHQQLKLFLHPKCDICSKEFGTRIDWDQHVLTAGHLKLASKGHKPMQEEEGNSLKRLRPGNEGNPNKRPKQSGDGSSSESILHKTESEKDKPLQAEKNNVHSDATMKITESPTKTVIKIDNENDAINLNQESIPEYDAQSEIGMEMLQEKTGYLCRCCNRFLSSSADAKTHCRSQFHYEKYVAFFKSKQLKSPKQNGNEVTTPTREIQPPEHRGKNELEEGKKQDALNEERKQGETTEEKIKEELKKEKFGEEFKEDSEKDKENDGKNDDIPKESSGDVKDDEIKEVVELEEEEEDEEDDSNWKRKRSSQAEEGDTNKDGAVKYDDQPSIVNKKKEELAIEKDKDLTQEDVNTLEDTVLLSNADGEDLDTTKDLEKTLLIEDAATPKAGKGRGGTALRSRGRKRK